eukprot:COSAG05_NODE_373_length_10684_cov_22.075012_16_plen_29_part_01
MDGQNLFTPLLAVIPLQPPLFFVPLHLSA